MSKTTRAMIDSIKFEMYRIASIKLDFVYSYYSITIRLNIEHSYNCSLYYTFSLPHTNNDNMNTTRRISSFKTNTQ